MTDRFVIINSNILTMDARGTRAEALAVSDGRVHRVGSNEDVRGLMDQGWPVWPLDGKTVLPGFIDSHEHLMMTGLQATGLDLSRAASLDEVLARCADAARKADKGRWIRGSGLNDQLLAERRMPTRHDLDRVSTDHPICLMHATLHLCALNSPALDTLKVPLDLPGLDMAGNQPTGVVRDPGIVTYVFSALSRSIPEAAKLAALEKASRMALERGVTTLHALDGGDFGPGDTAMIWHHRDRLPVRVVCYNQSMDLGEVQALGLPRVGGCICADGAFEAHTAALFEPYADDPDNYGELTFSQEVMDRFVLAANRAGLQVAVHCESERAIEQVLRAMEKALADFPRRDHRHRIEHLELPTGTQLERMAAAGVMASMQPAFIPAFIGRENMEHYERLLGRARLNRVHPYRTILDHGIRISGGSDSPVTPYDPLVGVQAAVTHPNPPERVSLREALEMFTVNGAWSAFEETEKGTIEAGKLADLVILGDDPHEAGADNISGIPVENSIVGGKPFRPVALEAGGRGGE